jgi:sigma-E factor negative regulatory protein RseA
MVATKSAPSGSGAPAVASADARIAVVSANAPEGVVLRDPRIDEYLLAHQRFSPSVYSTAQYARSATFATDSNK